MVIRQETNLQGDDPPEHVVPHAELHVKLRQLLVGLRARRSDLFRRADVLGEIQSVTQRYGNQNGRKGNEYCSFSIQPRNLKTDP